jgi:acyl-CoA thioester hydrolase
MSEWHEYFYVVSMRDTDATGLVFHPRYLEILTAAREDLADKLGINFEALSKECQSMLVVKDLELKFLKPVFHRNQLLIRTLISRVFNAKVVILQEIYICNAAERVLAMKSLLTYAHISRDTLMPIAVSQEVIDHLRSSEKH